MSALDVFWERLHQFLNVVLVYGAEIDPDPRGTVLGNFFDGKPILITNPLGFAECVELAMNDVESDSLAPDQASLFDLASRAFQEFCRRHGRDGGSDDCLSVTNLDDPNLATLRNLSEHRLPEKSWRNFDRGGSSLEVETVIPPTTDRKKPHVSKKGQPRDQGKGAKCKAAYIEACEQRKKLPTPSELANRFDCSTATASRAIKPLEDHRKGFASEARRDWEHESGRRHKGSVA